MVICIAKNNFKDFLNVLIFLHPQIPDFQILSYHNKPCINIKLICSAFRWWMVTKCTLMTGFVVQVYICVYVDSRACLWWWGWTHTDRVSRPPPDKLQSVLELSSPLGTRGRHNLDKSPQQSVTVTMTARCNIRLLTELIKTKYHKNQRWVIQASSRACLLLHIQSFNLKHLK